MNVTTLVPQMMSLIKSHRFVSLLSFSIVLTLVIIATYIIGGGLRQSTDAGFIMPHVFQGISLPGPVISPTDTTVEQSSIRIGTDQPTSNSSTAKSQVNINGDSLSVPETGSVHHVVQNANGVTVVDISVNSGSSGKSNSHSTTNVRLDTTAGSSIDIQEEQ